jgi:hypothetical protein
MSHPWEVNTEFVAELPKNAGFGRALEAAALS